MRVIRDELRDEQGNDLALYAGILAAEPCPGEAPDLERVPYEHPSRTSLGESGLDRIRSRAQDLDYWWPWAMKRGR